MVPDCFGIDLFLADIGAQDELVLVAHAKDADPALAVLAGGVGPAGAEEGDVLIRPDQTGQDHEDGYE